MILKKVRDLAIAKNRYFYTPEGINIDGHLDYLKWIEYINIHSHIFIWFEDTDKGKNILANIDKIPEDFKDSILSLLNKVRCFAEFNPKKNIYEISLGGSPQDNKKIAVSFNRQPNTNDLRMFLEMANYLDALLLYNGNEIIDEKVIESLE
jgi:hypothetical protein